MNKYDKELIDLTKNQRLRKMLDNSEFTSRKLSTLATAIGETESETKTRLSAIGARQLRNRRTGTVLFSLQS